MPRSTTIISIFLASPSDLDGEREVVSRTVQEWNNVNGFYRSVSFEILRWETSISAGFGLDGQDVINKQLPDYDILIALFWTRIGTPTDRSISGTAEEYERALSRRKSGIEVEIAFYFKEALIDPRDVDLEQLAAVRSFERRVQSEGALSKPFSSDDALRMEISLLLDRASRRFTASSQIQISPSVEYLSGPPSSQDIVSDEEDLGLFDISDNLQQHAMEATGALSDISAQIGVMTSIITEATDHLGGIARLRSVEPHEAKPIVSRIATGMNNLSSFLETSVPAFSENSISLAGDIRSLINVSYDFAKHHDDPVSTLSPFRVIITTMIMGMESSFEKFSEFVSVLNDLQRTTKEFNHARRRLVQNCINLQDSISESRGLMSQALIELDDLFKWLDNAGAK